MWWVFVTVGLAACAEPEERVVFGEVDGTDLLVDEAGNAFPERVLANDGATARLLPDGPTLNGSYAFALDSLVVVDPGEWPRITLDAGDVRVLLYLDRAELQARVVALVDGTGADGEGRVVFPPGAAIDVLDRDDVRVHVAVETDVIAVEAWLPRSAVDEVWRSDEVSVRSNEPWPAGTDRSLLGDTEVLDAPGGDPLARLGGSYDQSLIRVTVVGDEVRGYVPVVLSHDRIRIEGWAQVDDLRDELLGWGCNCGGGYVSGGWGRVTSSGAVVPAGTLLRAGVDGPVVGLALMDLAAPEEARADGVVLDRTTAFGDVALWVGPEDVL